MRRFFTIPAAGLLALALAAPAMAGANTGNFSGTLSLAQAGWDAYDEASQTYTAEFITVTVDESGGGAFADYSSYREQYLQCTGADTPDDPDDDTFGVAYSNIYGWGEGVSLTIGQRNASAHATGSIYGYAEEFNECTGEWTSEELGEFDFSLDLVATSPTVRESGRGSFHIPGEFNQHSSYTAVYRFAEGTFDGPNGGHDVAGQVGKVSWRDHSNG
jgi:hypothetical protein